MLYVSFCGNLGADAETNEVEGTTVVNFRVATKGGIKKDDPSTWISCAMWGERGNKVKDFLTTGKKVMVTGELRVREYEHNKETRFSLDVRVDQLELLGGGKSDDDEDGKKPADAKKDGKRETGREARR